MFVMIIMKMTNTKTMTKTTCLWWLLWKWQTQRQWQRQPVCDDYYENDKHKDNDKDNLFVMIIMTMTNTKTTTKTTWPVSCSQYWCLFSAECQGWGLISENWANSWHFLCFLYNDSGKCEMESNPFWLACFVMSVELRLWSIMYLKTLNMITVLLCGVNSEQLWSLVYPVEGSFLGLPVVWFFISGASSSPFM